MKNGDLWLFRLKIWWLTQKVRRRKRRQALNQNRDKNGRFAKREGKYNLEQENAYLAVYSALEEALLKLPIQTEADRKVKLQYLKNVIGVSIEGANFKYDFSAGYGCEEKAFAIIDQLTGE